VKLTIRDHSHCAAYTAPTDSPGMKAAIAALTAGFGKPPALTREGGTLPILPLFKEVLGADSLMLGFCMPDCNLHSPNEFFHIRDFVTGTRCILHFLQAIAGDQP
jgi:acetylornithine deacetylase/succinyl-diaminopimelate desuccinylase-like protein